MEVRVCNLRVKLPEPHLVAGAGIDASSRRAMGIFFSEILGKGLQGQFYFINFMIFGSSIIRILNDISDLMLFSAYSVLSNCPTCK